MFTENEVVLMLEDEQTRNDLTELKKDFLRTEAKYLEISDHDFLSLVLMAPQVSVALANGSVSLFEELALNKKARKLSKGGYFMKKDPVVIAMGYLIKHYDSWEEKFFAVLIRVMKNLCDFEALQKYASDEEISPDSFRKEVLGAPYGFIRFISSFFCNEDEDIINVEDRSINRVDYERIADLGKKLGLEEIPLFRHFYATFTVK